MYLPNSGLWVSEYPHADRTQFLDVSLQASQAGGAMPAAGPAAGTAMQAACQLVVADVPPRLCLRKGLEACVLGHACRLGARPTCSCRLLISSCWVQVEREAQEAQQQSQQQQPYEQAYEQEPYEAGGDREPRYGRSYGPGGAGGWPGDGYSQPHY